MHLNEFSLGSISTEASSKSLSHDQLLSQILKRKEYFAQKNFGPNSIAVLMNNNTPDFFVNLLSLWELGSCVTPLPSDLNIKIATELSLKLGASLIITKDHEEVFLNPIVKDLLPENSALVLYTSGSTGTPRGVVHNFQSVKAKVRALGRFIPSEDTKNTLCALPTCFGHGLICNSLFPLLTGNKLFIEPSFSPTLLGSLDSYINRNKISFLSSTPTILSFLKEFSRGEEKSSLRRLHTASAPLDQRHVDFGKTWCPNAKHFNVYGLTEMLGWVSGCEVMAGAPISVGHPWDVEWELNTQSEVLIHSQFKPIGFLEEENNTLSFKKFNDKFFNTLDLGEFDDQNNLRIIGRRKLVINKAGLKISPEEIEYLLSHCELVKESCCFPIADDILGEKIGLVVVPQPEFSALSSHQFVAKVQSWLSERLPSYKYPNLVKVVTELIYNERGKLDRRAVVTRFHNT